MRLNKYISSTGICSRREADRFIENGNVLVNGEVATFTTTVEENDEVIVNGKKLHRTNQTVYLMLNKPQGIVCTTDIAIEGNIITFMDYPERIFPVGRLDKDSTGLILLTNDGDIVNALLRSEHGHTKDYIVHVDRPVTSEFMRNMEAGVEIYNPVSNRYVITKPCTIEKIDVKVFRLTLTQGLNRQIRRMCTKLGYHVQYLKRVKFMSLELDDLKDGEYRELEQDEILLLKQSSIQSNEVELNDADWNQEE